MEKIYDDILKFYFAQNFLEVAPATIRNQFTGENWKAKLINYMMPFAKFARRHFEYNRHFKPHFTTKNLGGKVWLFIGSQNNRSSLKFLLDELEGSVLVGYGVPLHESDSFQIPFYQTVLSAWRFPKIWYFFRKKYGSRAVKFGDFLFNCVGLYEVAFAVLKKYRPKCLILANDHSEKQRALLNAAKQLNIPVIYIQHASISDFMPPLDFDLSLLEGQDAWDKYKKLGKIQGEVRLIGMPKFDSFMRHRNTSKTVQNIGICSNLFDNQAGITRQIKTIQSKFPTKKITFRPHPADKRHFEIPDSVVISTKSEGIFDFLKRQDLLIAGSSSVHLEAVLLNVSSIYFEVSPMQKNMQDAYGYVKNGLIEQANDLEDLVDKIEREIKNRQPVFQKAQYYNALVGTESEGKSGALAGRYIREFLDKKWL
jgi:hypothetical protein